MPVLVAGTAGRQLSVSVSQCADDEVVSPDESQIKEF